MGTFQTIHKYFKPSTVNLLQPSMQPSNCLCALISPVLWISLVLGQNVSCKSHVDYLEATLPCSKDKIIRQSCIFQHRARSFGSIVNWVFLSFFVYTTFWIYTNLGDHLGVFFHGTDLYTFGFEIISIYIQTTLFLLFARIRAPYLSKCLNHIQKLYVIFTSWDKRCANIDTRGGDKKHKSLALIKKIQVVSYILVIFVSISSVIYAIVFLYTIFGLTIPYVDEKRDSDPQVKNLLENYQQDLTKFLLSQFGSKRTAWREPIFILEKFAHILVPLQSQVFTTLFAVTALTIRNFYLRLGECLASLLSPFFDKELFDPATTSVLMAYEQGQGPQEKRTKSMCGSSASPQLASEIERIRLVYEELQQGVEYLSQYFGPGLVVSCSISVLAITSGVYTIILEQTDLSTPIDDQDQEKRSIRKYFYCTWAIHIYFALFSLLTILISGENITNAASVPGKVLKSVTQVGFNEEMKHQVNLFLKSSEYPTHVSACRIMNINLCFLGTAGTQLITYVLVLLQFRLGNTNAETT